MFGYEAGNQFRSADPMSADQMFTWIKQETGYLLSALRFPNEDNDGYYSMLQYMVTVGAIVNANGGGYVSISKLNETLGAATAWGFADSGWFSGSTHVPGLKTMINSWGEAYYKNADPNKETYYQKGDPFDSWYNAMSASQTAGNTKTTMLSNIGKEDSQMMTQENQILQGIINGFAKYEQAVNSNFKVQ